MRFVFNFVTFSPLKLFKLWSQLTFVRNLSIPFSNLFSIAKSLNVFQRILCRFSLWDPANRNGKTWTNESHEENRLHGFFSSNLSVTFCENLTKRGFVLDIILILTTNFYNHFLHLQIGLMFFSEHKIKGDSCFWIGNHFRHGFDFDQTLSFNLTPFHYGFTFQWARSEHCWQVQSALSLSHF